jgi:anthranilate synthase component 1
MSAVGIKPDRTRFRELAQQGNLVPVYAEIVADFETPVSVFHKIDRGGYSFLLESAEHVDEGGRYSFVGVDPAAVFEVAAGTVKITDNAGAREYPLVGDPLVELEKIMAAYRPVKPDDDMPRFYGGAVGYLAYDAVRYFEPTVGASPPDDLGLPDALFVIAETVLIFDHKTRRLRVLVNACADGDPDAAYDRACGRIAGLIERIGRPLALPIIDVHREPETIGTRSNTTRDEYEGMVRRCHEFIHAGDAFQVVPSQRFEAEYPGDPLTLYRCLRYVNPSPYLFCLKFAGRFALVGSSPEVHVRAIDGKLDIRPIAGTRPRGATPSEDEANARELLADEKELAEHVMLVDLARNDVGRVADYSSVRVTDFQIIERYSHVMHIVSNVVGMLRQGRTAYDVLRATFPAGTVSGSPKVRAMQIINGLEKNRRGTYAGAVGYFGFDGNHDSCIALRTVLLKEGKAYVQAGAGVVADSVPANEYRETVNKAMGMMRAIAFAKDLSPG